jgi:hypothetical protein
MASNPADNMPKDLMITTINTTIIMDSTLRMVPMELKTPARHQQMVKLLMGLRL